MMGKKLHGILLSFKENEIQNMGKSRYGKETLCKVSFFLK
ncbi:MAG: hypothetical protein PG977_000770 [Bartonella clarridgeiae]|nr:MAG: hypothetical protein PG977_000770 [Bartonella clarridgeiae]